MNLKSLFPFQVFASTYLKQLHFECWAIRFCGQLLIVQRLISRLYEFDFSEYFWEKQSSILSFFSFRQDKEVLKCSYKYKQVAY